MVYQGMRAVDDVPEPMFFHNSETEYEAVVAMGMYNASKPKGEQV